MKETLEKMLESLGAEPTDLKITILEMVLESKDDAIGKQAIIDILEKTEGMNPTETRKALQSLNTLGILEWTIKKGVAIVSITHKAYIAYLKIKYGEPFANAYKKSVKGVSHLLEEFGEGLKEEKKEVKNWIAGGFEKLAKKMRE